MKAIKILWNTTERNYGNLVAGVDYQITSSSFTFPSSDPDFDPTLANPMEEMLIMTDIVSQSTPDSRSYTSMNYITPTNVKNATFKNVNEYQTTVIYKFKTLSELIVAIKLRETEANLAIRLVADFDKTSMFWGSISPKVGVSTLTETEQKVATRISEVQSCASANDENVRRLVAIATNNDDTSNQQQAFDINSGWQETSEYITMIDIPFNELTV